MCDGCEVNQKYYTYTLTEATKEDKLLESLCIPTQTVIRSQLGAKLADVFFENLSSEGRVILGLVPPLTGPKTVWIDPAARLKGQVKCTPIPEPAVLYKKAITHKVILELGQEYIKSLQLKMKQEISQSLKQQASELENDCNKRLIEALEEAKINADEHCRQVVGTMMEHFDRCFSEMVETSKLKMRKECQLRVQEERAELASHMLEQLQEQVEKRDLELCSEFHDTLNGELNALSQKFMRQMDAERKVAREMLEETVRDYEKKLADLRSEMEVTSFVDVCRAITEEREQMVKGSKGAGADERRQLVEMHKYVAELDVKNKTLQEMATERAKRIKVYRKKMKRLIDEFQKFVNFATKSVPGHSEYLLSSQKMILKAYHEDSLMDPDEYAEFKNCLKGKLPEGEPVEETEPDTYDVCIAAEAEGESETTERKTEEDDEEDKENCKTEPDSRYAFNYYRFKYTLLKKLVKGVRFGTGEKEFRSPPPTAHTRTSTTAAAESAVDQSGDDNASALSAASREAVDEFREELRLVGETARDHLRPTRTFLQERRKTIVDMCRDDPEMVRMVLGCPKREVRPGPVQKAPGCGKPC